METGQIIKKLRKEHHLTQEQLGEICGVQKSAIAKYERGAIVNIKREHYEKMANYFGVRPAYIMGMTDDALKLNDDEVKLMIAFRRADPDIQKAIRLMLKVNV